MKHQCYLKKFLLLFVLIVTQQIFGQFENMVPQNTITHQAIKSGKWSDPTIWSSNSVPGLSAIVWIPHTIEVNYDMNSEAHIFLIRNDGTFTITPKNRKKRKLVVDSFLGGRDSFLRINADTDDSGAVEIIIKPFDIERKKAGLIQGTRWKNSAKRKYSDGKRVTNHYGNPLPSDGPGVLGRYEWDPRQATLGIMSWGKVRINGRDKLDFSESSSHISKNSNRFSLKEEPDGWMVGDKVVLSGTENLDHNEIVTISAISGKAITLSTPLKHDHKGITLDNTKYYTYAANLTRNVVIRSFHTSIENHHTRRGHVMFMFNGDVSIQNASFKDLGRTNKINIIDDLQLGVPVLLGSGGNQDISFPDLKNEMETDPSKIENQRGRYGLHFHKSLRGQNSSKLIRAQGNVVWGSPGWGMVHHDSHADFTNNVVLQISGGAMVAESGSETGVWKNNFVTGGAPKRSNVAPNGIPLTSPIRRTLRALIDDDFKSPSAYALQGRAVEMVGNVASSVSVAYHYQGNGHEVIVSDKLNTKVFEANDRVNPFPFQKSVLRTAVPFIRFDNNIGFNCKDGFKSQNRSDSGAFNRVISVVSNLTIWNSNRFGTYISSNFGYLIKDSKFHAYKNSDPKSSTGALIQKDNDNIHFNNVIFYGYESKGVNVNTNETNDRSGNHENSKFIFNKVQWKDSPKSFKPYKNNTNGQIVVTNVEPSNNPRIRFISASDMDNEVDLNGDFTFAIKGEVIDQIGKSVFAHFAPKSEPFLERVYTFKDKTALEKELLSRYEMFTDSKGDFIWFEEFISDRITGITKPVRLKIYIKNFSKTLTKNIEKSPFILYPNPASTRIAIAVPKGKKNVHSIHIINTLGLIVAKIYVNEEMNVSGKAVINIAHYASGTYIVKLMDSSGLVLKTFKLLKS